MASQGAALLWSDRCVMPLIPDLPHMTRWGGCTVSYTTGRADKAGSSCQQYQPTGGTWAHRLPQTPIDKQGSSSSQNLVCLSFAYGLCIAMVTITHLIGPICPSHLCTWSGMVQPWANSKWYVIVACPNQVRSGQQVILFNNLK